LVDAIQRVRLSPLQPRQFSLRGLFIFSFSVAVGLSFWKTEQDWFVGALAASSFWIVVGLAAQMRDIRTGSWVWNRQAAQGEKMFPCEPR
jgi:hypothetical protein